MKHFKHFKDIMSSSMHRVVGSEIRRQILHSLIEGEKYLSEISTEVNRAPQTVDFHLTKLAELGIVKGVLKEGKKFYSFANNDIKNQFKNHKHFCGHFKSTHDEILTSLDELNKKIDRVEKKIDKIMK